MLSTPGIGCIYMYRAYFYQTTYHIVVDLFSVKDYFSTDDARDRVDPEFSGVLNAISLVAEWVVDDSCYAGILIAG